MQSLKHPPRLWLNASTATIYRHTYDRPMDEFTGEFGGEEPDAPPTWRFSIDVARQWEQAFSASPTPETRKIALRTAMVMSPEPGGIFAIILRLVRVGLGGAWGNGRQYMSWIHDVDFVHAIEFLIEHEDISGAVNLASPNPLPNSQFVAGLRDAWGIRLGLPSAAWMLSPRRTRSAHRDRAFAQKPACGSRHPSKSQLSVLLSCMVRSGSRPCTPLAHQ